MTFQPLVDGPRQAALLIDADNFHDPQSIDASWAQLKAKVGRVSVCRAYGNVLGLQKLVPVWRTLGARTFPNLALEKNTTDAALVADAVALYFQQGIRFFAIASGDADFAPLVVRLREWGCEVWCFSMEGILFNGAEAYYDRVVRFRPPVTEPIVPVKPVVPVSKQEVVAAPKQEVLPLSVAPMMHKPLAVPTPVPNLPQPNEVQRILSAVPALRKSPQLLSQVVPILRQQGILGKTEKSTLFFARYGQYLQLSPTHQPTVLSLLSSPVSSEKELPARRALSTIEEKAFVSLPIYHQRAIQPVIRRAEVHALRATLAAVAFKKTSVADILFAVPELLLLRPCALAGVYSRLRQERVIRPSASGLLLLQGFPQSFQIRKGPPVDAVQYLG